MNRRHITTPALVDGVDVAHLLHGIGEASAESSPVDLFGLCLDAQRVLGQVSTSGAGILSPEEAAVLAAFRALSRPQRDIMLGFARACAEQPARQRPALALVKGGSHG